MNFVSASHRRAVFATLKHAFRKTKVGLKQLDYKLASKFPRFDLKYKWEDIKEIIPGSFLEDMKTPPWKRGKLFPE